MHKKKIQGNNQGNTNNTYKEQNNEKFTIKVKNFDDSDFEWIRDVKINAKDTSSSSSQLRGLIDHDINKYLLALKTLK